MKLHLEKTIYKLFLATTLLESQDVEIRNRMLKSWIEITNGML